METIKPNTHPVQSVFENEFYQQFTKFCSFVCIANNKKINLANIFVLLLKDTRYRLLFKRMCDISSDYDILKHFLHVDPTLHKSKYISNYLSKHKINL